jgi:hypothetical protein
MIGKNSTKALMCHAVSPDNAWRIGCAVGTMCILPAYLAVVEFAQFFSILTAQPMRSSLARRALFILVILLLAAGATIRSIQPLCAQSIGVDVPELQDSPLFLAEKRAGDVDVHEEMGTPTDA